MKKLGFSQIKIYNGGLKDWKKSGFRTEDVSPLPEYECRFITVEALLNKITNGESCGSRDGENSLTLVDYRTEPFLKSDRPVPYIPTVCRVVFCLMDDLRKSQVRDKIPRTGLVVLISETGNRDWAAIRYLSKWGFTNIVGLQYGMRGWLKSGYPVDYLKQKPVQ